MKLRIYLNNEDGTFTRIYDYDHKKIDTYNRPYKGNGVSVKNKNLPYLIYDIKIENNIVTCYVCDIYSKLADGIERYSVEALNHPHMKIYVCSPEKYMEGKKCRMFDGDFIMGKVLEKQLARDFYLKGLEFSSCNSTCMI